METVYPQLRQGPDEFEISVQNKWSLFNRVRRDGLEANKKVWDTPTPRASSVEISRHLRLDRSCYIVNYEKSLTAYRGGDAREEAFERAPRCSVTPTP